MTGRSVPLADPPFPFTGALLIVYFRGPKKHINSFNINFLAPTQNTQFFGAQKRVYVPRFWERTQKGTHINFLGGIFGSKRGSQTGHFRPDKV